jgi:hypothetical protein
VKRNFCEFVGKRENGIILLTKIAIEMRFLSLKLLSDIHSEIDDEHLL